MLRTLPSARVLSGRQEPSCRALPQPAAPRREQYGESARRLSTGGSDELGTWGYVEAGREMREQAEASGLSFQRIYFGCGSGGTAAGLALAHHLSGWAAAGCELVGLGVDDDPAFFINKIDGILAGVGVTDFSCREVLRLEDCVGEGYATSTAEELAFLVEVAQVTGVVLDPVYSGKAALGMVEDLKARPVDGRVLFLHTGGLLGLYAKEAQLMQLLGGDGLVGPFRS